MSFVLHKSSLLTAFVAALSISNLSAEAKAIPTSCGATDILKAAQKTEPENYRKIKAAAAAVKNGDGLLWRIEKSGIQPSYLFGTMHSTDPRLDRHVNRIKPLIARSHSVAVEISELVTPGNKEAASLEIARAGVARSGNALEALHPPQNRFLVEASLLQRGIPPAVAEKLEVWFLIVALSSPLCERERRALKQISVDEKIGLAGSRRAAAKAKGPVIGLEKLEDQIAVLRQIGGWNAPATLIATAQGAGQIANMRETLTQAYIGDRLGEVAALSRISEILSGNQPSAESARFTKSLLDDRNLVMRDNSLPLLQKGGAFIAVGALHLPFEGGLVELYRQQGYRVSVVK
jgi:uncharacterized protein